MRPFESDEGDTAFEGYRKRRSEYPYAPILDRILWAIEEAGEIGADEYADENANKSRIEEQLADKAFDDHHFIYVVDANVIATGFGRFADEGKGDSAAKPYLARTLKRQIVWTELTRGPDQYIQNLVGFW